MEELHSNKEPLNWDVNEVAMYDSIEHTMRFVYASLFQLLVESQPHEKNCIDIGGGRGELVEFLLSLKPRHVTLVDISPAMLRKARERMHITDPDQYTIAKADATDLPYREDSFDILTAVTVACNLTTADFQKHFSEANRVAKPGAVWFVVAPNVVGEFTDGSVNGSPAATQKYIDQHWEQVARKTPAAAKKIVESLQHVTSATFVLDDDNKPILITEETKHLAENGTPIIRKLPGVVVDNVFYHFEAYEQEAQRSGWVIERKLQNCFASVVELAEYNPTVPANQQLGPEYIGNPPFTIYAFRKA